MYSISKEPVGHYTLCTIKNKHTGEYFSFFPDYGASFNQLVLKGKDRILRPLLYESKDEQQLLTEGKTMYKGAKLFPFPNRINGGNYLWEGKQYQLPIDEVQEGHAHHGLVYKSRFVIVEERCSEEEGAVMVQYRYDNETEGYPFQVTVHIVFTLNKQGFSCRTIVINEDKVPIPFSDGWHPYFQLDVSIENSSLHFQSVEEIEVDKKMIPTGNTKPTTSFTHPQKLGLDFFDTCFRLQKEREQNVYVVDLLDEKQEGIRIWLKPPYRYLHVYTPPARNCVALEPMTSPADVFNNQIDLIVLEPGARTELVWGIDR